LGFYQSHIEVQVSVLGTQVVNPKLVWEKINPQTTEN